MKQQAFRGEAGSGVPAGGFASLYAEEYGRVLAVAYALSGSWVVAEEVTQEAFLKAFRRWEQVAGFAHPGAWVRTVAANLARSRLRRAGAEVRALLRLGGRTASGPDPIPEDLKAVWQAVRRLPGRQAQAVVLYYLADLPVAEVAAHMGVAEGTVKAHLHQARRRLEQTLEEDQP